MTSKENPVSFLDVKRLTADCGRLQSRLQWTLIGWLLTAAFAVVGWLR